MEFVYAFTKTAVSWIIIIRTSMKWIKWIRFDDLNRLHFDTLPSQFSMSTMIEIITWTGACFCSDERKIVETK